ncbi:four helix bundle protein [Thalassotalea sp. PS06]|uniref:four helix bundle protein n=1 Tax=Thalassotalea sp. PS06 TaxID=2594005 RepID=UPI0011627299|nr:four helix bundle protein [Thalassotalea sp. PS06]QDP01978.1 four helix bundle protein [Thalassotalea sp. PS06]
MKFEQLNVWQRSLALSKEVYLHFKSCPDYGFKDQITRSSLSIPSNIAEGHERQSTKELIRFLMYSRGSCGELRTQIYLGIEIDYIDSSVGQRWIDESIEISKMITGLIKYRKENFNE